MVAKREENKEEYDEEFLELWDENEFTQEELKISELFSDKQHQQRESKIEKERTPSPFLKRRTQNHRRSIQSVKKVVNPFKRPRIASEVHVIPRKQPLTRKRVGQANVNSRHQNRPAVKETTSQICERLNLHVRINNPLAKQRSAASQTTFNCDVCTQLESKLKAAEIEIKRLQQQLLEQQTSAKVDQSCQKCSKRTNQRNIRQRNKQKQYRDFFVAQQNETSSAQKTN